jgi:signal transduction histidine kinase
VDRAPAEAVAAVTPVLDEVALGVAELTPDGRIVAANAPARALVASAAGEALEALLAELAARARETGLAVVEARHDLGWGEVRVVVGRARAEGGFIAALERNAERTLSRHARALRDVLAAVAAAVAAADSAHEALPRAVRALAAALTGTHLALHVIGRDGAIRCAARSSGPHVVHDGGVPSDGTALAAQAIAHGLPAHAAGRGGGAVAVPVRWRGAVVGALHACGPRLAEPELRMIQGLADAAGALVGRARAEEALEEERRARAELADRAERARAAAVEREGLATLGQLAACVTHEVASPLACLHSNLNAVRRGLAEMARLARDGGCSEPAGGGRAAELALELGQLVDESHHDVQRMTGIVHALKGLSRRRPGERVAFDPSQAIDDAVRIFRGAHRSGSDVELARPEALPEVLGAPASLSQVVLNLLENGIDAMGGRGSLRVIAEAAAGRRVRIAVSDQGPGVRPDARARVFEAYFTTKPPGKGTGLGLAICREIVEGMGGTIGFETGPRGTTFVVELPPAES